MAEKAVDALSKLLHAVHIELRNFPFDAGARSESRYCPVDTVVPGNVGDKVFDTGKGFHGEDGDGLVLRENVHARLTSQAGAAVDFRGTRAALPCFTIPADGDIGGAWRLTVVQGIKDNHAARHRPAIVLGF